MISKSLIDQIPLCHPTSLSSNRILIVGCFLENLQPGRSTGQKDRSIAEQAGLQRHRTVRMKIMGSWHVVVSVELAVLLLSASDN
jgi:hypothetical protein